MTNFVFTNFFSTTLSAAVLSTATTITVSSSANLPTLATGQVMPIVLTSASNPSITEICYVTAIGGTTLTVERAQEGTGALAWSVGDFVSCDITAQSVAAVDGNAANQFAVATATSGSNAVNYSQFIAAIGGFSGVLSNVTVSEQLPSSFYGNAIQVGASGITITLPASNGSVGQAIWFYNALSTGSYTINVTGSGQFIYAPTCGYLTSNTSIPVNAGEWLCIMSRGNGEFDVVAGSWLNNHQNSQSVEFYAPIQIPNAISGNQAVALGQLEITTLARNTANSFTSGVTLTAANAGQIIYYTGTAAATFTLPAANAAVGYTMPIIISNQSGYPLTVAPPSGNSLDLNPSVLNGNQYCAVNNDGNTAWHTLWNTAGSTSPVVVGNATSSNNAVALGQTLLSASIYDVTASRAITTTYTNSTGKVMFVSANGVSNATSGNFYFTVGGKVVGSGVPQTASNIQLYASALVPIGATYQLNGSISSLTAWIEEY